MALMPPSGRRPAACSSPLGHYPAPLGAPSRRAFPCVHHPTSPLPTTTSPSPPSAPPTPPTRPHRRCSPVDAPGGVVRVGDQQPDHSRACRLRRVGRCAELGCQVTPLVQVYWQRAHAAAHAEVVVKCRVIGGGDEHAVACPIARRGGGGGQVRCLLTAGALPGAARSPGAPPGRWRCQTQTPRIAPPCLPIGSFCCSARPPRQRPSSSSISRAAFRVWLLTYPPSPQPHTLGRLPARLPPL
jgi:hypothetical protein